MRYAQIKGLVNFKYTGTAWNKRKIKKYFDELEPLISQPNTIYRPRNSGNLKIAAESAGLNPRLKGLKAIPIFNNGVNNTKVRIKKGRVKLVRPFEEREIILFDQEKLASEGEDYINSLLDFDAEKFEGMDFEERQEFFPDVTFQIMAGKHIVRRGGISLPNIAPTISQYMNNYNAPTKKHGDTTWREWLHGVIRIESTNQKETEKVISEQNTKTKAYRQKTRKQYKGHKR